MDTQTHTQERIWQVEQRQARYGHLVFYHVYDEDGNYIGSDHCYDTNPEMRRCERRLEKWAAEQGATLDFTNKVLEDWAMANVYANHTETIRKNLDAAMQEIETLHQALVDANTAFVAGDLDAVRASLKQADNSDYVLRDAMEKAAWAAYYATKA